MLSKGLDDHRQLPEIYEARDGGMEKQKISSEHLKKKLDENGKAALYMPNFDHVVAFLEDKVDPSVVVVTMGAGNVDEVARRFLKVPVRA